MRRFELDPDWYRLKYNLAVSQVRLAVTREETDHDRLGDRRRRDVLSDARHTALELSVTAADTRNTLRYRRWIRRPKRLNAFLRELVEPGGRVLLAEALLAEPKANVGRLFDGEPGLNEDAITRSLRGMLDGEKADVPLPDTLARSVGPREDRRAEGGIPAPSAQGRPDRGEDLGGRGGGGRASGRSRDGLAAEVHYELACYFSQLYGVLEERAVQAQPAEPTAARGPEVETDALKELACCLRRLDRGARRDQIQWARRDPLLASVRDSGGAGREFTQQLERYSRPATQQELGELQAIGPDGAKSLAEVGITTWRDLRRVDRPDTRSRLAELGAKDPESWLHVGELLELDSMGVGYANLLRRAGIGSLLALGKRTAKELEAELLNLVKEKRHVPPSELIEVWTQSAREAARVRGQAR